MSFDEQPDPLSDCMEACDRFKRRITALEASAREKDAIIETLKAALLQSDKCESGHFKYQSCDCRLQALQAYNSLPAKSALDEVINQAKAEAWEEAAEFVKNNTGFGEVGTPQEGAVIVPRWQALKDKAAALRAGRGKP